MRRRMRMRRPINHRLLLNNLHHAAMINPRTTTTRQRFLHDDDLVRATPPRSAAGPDPQVHDFRGGGRGGCCHGCAAAEASAGREREVEQVQEEYERGDAAEDDSDHDAGRWRGVLPGVGGREGDGGYVVAGLELMELWGHCLVAFLSLGVVCFNYFQRQRRGGVLFLFIFMGYGLVLFLFFFIAAWLWVVFISVAGMDG
ncbi:hypothetical protein P175DRAFT_0155734 [Aspergillus ochraceoroseus IBT 24754]|uniref:Uncharacterized protein n=1 Tax=Aspergillus ochraceoroseus IBT 24754 TaxID=1392256 RepID=A0A2T5M3E0_9EURO|nr:uncharacterized protein P175DRAFT_0155734 [Aspergillus ochraceoroseus IBT 24754]PTU23039.1 hypothetical protein P175DRAFT_0155734 [Aspergillus ochraceoroseus IBT 24754]